MTKPKLHIAPSPERAITRAEIMQAQIEQDMREWQSPNPDITVRGWQPIETAASNPLDVDATVSRGTHWVVSEARVPWWRVMLRWLRGLL